MSFKDNFNKNQGGFPESSSSNVQEDTKTLIVSNVTVKTASDKDGNEYDYLAITLETSDKEKTEVRQNINYDQNGVPKSLVWPTYTLEKGADKGKEIPASIVYDIMHLAKELDSDLYESKKVAAKKKYGDEWIGKEFLEGLMFDIPVRRIEKDDKVYLFPLFTKQIFADEARKRDMDTQDKYSATRPQSGNTEAEVDPKEVEKHAREREQLVGELPF